MLAACCAPFSALADDDKEAPIVWWTELEVKSGRKFTISGDVIRLTASITDKEGIDSVFAVFCSYNGKDSFTVYPTYNSAEDIYEAEFETTDDTYPGYWYLARLMAIDVNQNNWDMYPGEDAYCYGVAGVISNEDITLEQSDYTYCASPIIPKLSVTYKGSKLRENTDYKITCKNNLNVGTASVRIEGINCFTGDFTREYRILPKSEFSAELSRTSYVYNGELKSPGVKVFDGSYVFPRESYTLTYDNNRDKVGVHAVTVEPLGNYTGKKTLYYTVAPSSTSIKKLTAKKKSITVFWKKKTAQVTGYQIQYSTNKRFSKKATKTVTVKSNKKTKKTLKKLKAKKRYFVRIRTYKTVDGKKYYSAWSKTKKCSLKK